MSSASGDKGGCSGVDVAARRAEDVPVGVPLMGFAGSLEEAGEVEWF